MIYETWIFKWYIKLIDYIKIKKWNPSIIRRNPNVTDIWFSSLSHIFCLLFQPILVLKHPHLTKMLSISSIIRMNEMFQFKTFFPFSIPKTMKENGILGTYLEIQCFHRVRENSPCTSSVIFKNTPTNCNSK